MSEDLVSSEWTCNVRTLIRF